MPGRVQHPLFAHFTEVAGADDRIAEGSSIIEAWRASIGLNDSGTVESANSTAKLFGASGNAAGSSAQGIALETGSAAGGNVAESLASTFLESGFGMAALVKGLFGLFGGDAPTQQPFERYEMPPAITFESAETAAGLTAGSYDQAGAMRPVGTGGSQSETSSGGSRDNPPQINVNVQAMDAQSFLDHSEQIAQAVRGAMLSMSSINDVVNEL